MKDTVLLLGLLTLLCTIVHGQFIPTISTCGNPSDFVAVTSFPHTITSRTDELTEITTTFVGPFPQFNATCYYSGVMVSWILRQLITFRETNGSSDNPEIFKTVQMLENITWDVSAVNTASCEGFYLKTTLDNGGIIEFAYETFHEARNFTYGNQTFTYNKGDTMHYDYVSNYPFAHPNISTLQFQNYAKFPQSRSKADVPPFTFLLGTVPAFKGKEPNTTEFGAVLLPHNADKVDRKIDTVTAAFTYIDYSLVNLIPAHVVLSAAPEEMTGAGVLSITLTESHLGQFSGIQDIFFYIGKGFFELHFTDSEADGDMDSGSESLLEKSIFSTVNSFF